MFSVVSNAHRSRYATFLFNYWVSISSFLSRKGMRPRLGLLFWLSGPCVSFFVPPTTIVKKSRKKATPTTCTRKKVFEKRATQIPAKAFFYQISRSFFSHSVSSGKILISQIFSQRKSQSNNLMECRSLHPAARFGFIFFLLQFLL